MRLHEEHVFHDPQRSRKSLLARSAAYREIITTGAAEDRSLAGLADAAHDDAALAAATDAARPPAGAARPPAGRTAGREETR